MHRDHGSSCPGMPPHQAHTPVKVKLRAAQQCLWTLRERPHQPAPPQGGEEAIEYSEVEEDAGCAGGQLQTGILALAPASCVALGELLTLCNPQFPPL